jgi:hypothetical protein
MFRNRRSVGSTLLAHPFGKPSSNPAIIRQVVSISRPCVRSLPRPYSANRRCGGVGHRSNFRQEAGHTLAQPLVRPSLLIQSVLAFLAGGGGFEALAPRIHNPTVTSDLAFHSKSRHYGQGGGGRLKPRGIARNSFVVKILVSKSFALKILTHLFCETRAGQGFQRYRGEGDTPRVNTSKSRFGLPESA